MNEGVHLWRFARSRLDGAPRWVVWYIIGRLGLTVSRVDELLDDGQQAAIEAEWRRMIAGHPDITAHLRALELERSRRVVRKVVPAGWLVRHTSVEEAEAGRCAAQEARARERELAGKPPLPPPKYPLAGSRSWEALCELMQSGDELWWFSTSAESWRGMCGRAGYAVVRNGQVVGSLVTEMN